MDPLFGDVPPRAGFKSPSDTLNPHGRPFAGMLDRHPRLASGHGGCSILAFLGGPPYLVLAWVTVSCIRAYGERRRLVTPAGAQGPAIRVVGEDHAVGAQLVDQRSRAVRAGQLRQAAVSAVGLPGEAGQQDGEGGQVREDLVLADIGVLRPGGIGDGGAGVAVAATGRRACRWTTPIPAAARTARTR